MWKTNAKIVTLQGMFLAKWVWARNAPRAKTDLSQSIKAAKPEPQLPSAK